MTTDIAPSFTLTTEHSASSYGHPVLVRLSTGEAYGPGDVIEAYPSWGFTPARQAVARMASTAQLDEDGRLAVETFTGGAAE